MAKPLKLWPGSRPCVHCGFCCKKTPCGFGRLHSSGKGCAFLTEKPDGTYDCGIFDEIVGGKDETWKVSPAFGAGCCSPMNEDRARIVRKTCGGDVVPDDMLG